MYESESMGLPANITMRWNFVRRTWVKTSPELSECGYRKKSKPKRTRLWTFLCSQGGKPNSLQNSREELGVSHRRRSKTHLKFRSKHAASIESISDLMINFPRKSSVFNHVPPLSPSTVATSVGDNPRNSALGFCPHCHNIVLPVSEQSLNYDILPDNHPNHIRDVNATSTDSVQYWPYDVNADCRTMYESVYEGNSFSLDYVEGWEWKPDINTLIGRPSPDLDTSAIYDVCVYQDSGVVQNPFSKQYPLAPWASSTLKRGKRSAMDCETVYDEVASDFEDQLLDCSPVEDIRPYLKRCAPELDNDGNQMKRIRREFFVYEE